MLHIVTGRAGCGKTAEVFRRMKEFWWEADTPRKYIA